MLKDISDPYHGNTHSLIKILLSADRCSVSYIFEICKERLSPQLNERINISTDSQAALTASPNLKVISRLVGKWREELKVLACRNRLILYWVPRPSGMTGYEKTDDCFWKVLGWWKLLECYFLLYCRSLFCVNSSLWKT